MRDAKKSRLILAGVILFVTTITLTSCPSPIEQDPLPEGIFYARKCKKNDTSWYTVTAEKKAEGNHCIIYVENTTGITVETAQEIATHFDSTIYHQIRDSFGTEADVDNNAKVVLLFLDIIDDYAPLGGYVAGYFDSYHEFIDTYSNQADMLFIDTKPGIAGDEQFYSTIAHEFQHLISWSNTVRINISAQNRWINEGLSSGAEYIYSGTQIDKIKYFNTDPDGTIKNGNNFFVWKDEFVDYSTVYLFFQWLRIHANNGIGIYKEILNSSYSDYQAVTEAAAYRINPKFKDWQELLGTWMMANILNRPDATNEWRGYKKQLGTISMPENTSANNTACNLAPGEGIVSAMPSGGFTPSSGSGTNIKYIGLSTDGSEDGTSTYTGDYALVYNTNKNFTSSVETGYIANIANPTSVETTPSMTESAGRSIDSGNSLPYRYPIDVLFDQNEQYNEK